MTREVAIGLGGNLGDPVASFALAIGRFRAHEAITVTALSSVYRTAPWGNRDQPEFRNMAALLRTSLDPVTLLTLCLAIEHEAGRERRERWGPRTLDLDILKAGDAVIDRPRLQLPHPRAAQRAFVLVPLAEIAPQMTLGDTTVSELLSALPTDDVHLDEAETARLREMLG